MDYSIQLYSVEDYVSETSLKEGIRAVAEMGYKYVEFCEYHGHTAEEIKGFMDEYGVKCSGSHVHIKALLPNEFDKTVAFHKTLGCDSFILPSCNWSTPEKRDEAIRFFNEMQQKLENVGMHLAYHNHDSEFMEDDGGIVFSDYYLNKSTIDLEVDTFWLYNAQVDVVSFLDKYKERVRFIHLKDGIVCKAEKVTIENRRDGVEGRPVGYGDVDVKAIHNWAAKNNVLIVVENENTTPDFSKKSIDYLKTLD